MSSRREKQMWREGRAESFKERNPNERPLEFNRLLWTRGDEAAVSTRDGTMGNDGAQQEPFGVWREKRLEKGTDGDVGHWGQDAAGDAGRAAGDAAIRDYYTSRRTAPARPAHPAPPSSARSTESRQPTQPHSILTSQPYGAHAPPAAATPTTTAAIPTTTAPPRPQYMGAMKRTSSGAAKPVGPHPGTIKVAAPYLSQHQIDARLKPPALTNDAPDATALGMAEAREDAFRLQGISWLDAVRRKLELPARTLTTACVCYHKFRLAHPGGDYNFPDAAAAALLQACKVEDSLKKSRDILAAAWNVKAGAGEQLTADDAVFEAPSRAVVGLERLILEASGFDFRSRYPHAMVVKIAKGVPAGTEEERVEMGRVAWGVMTDLHRTFAPLKHTAATLAVAALELAARFVHNAAAQTYLQTSLDLATLSTARDAVMETLLDALDLYTHHAAYTTLGATYTMDDFLRNRLALNRECAARSLPRFTHEPGEDKNAPPHAASVTHNGHPTPISPADRSGVANGIATTASGAIAGQGADGGTLRFMLDPARAAAEKARVADFFREEWEEFVEESEVELPPERERVPDRERAVDRERDRAGERDRAIDRDRERDEAERRRRERGREEDGRRREREDERYRDRERGRERYDERDHGRERFYDERRRR